MEQFDAIVVSNEIVLEVLDEKHAAPILNLVNNNRNHLREWLTWVDNMHSVEDFTNFIVNSKKRHSGGSELSYAILFNKALAGRIGIYNIDPYHKIASIGYWLGQEFEGKGIVTKACRALVDYCFNSLDLNRIEIKCATKNYKSQAVPQRLNFTNEGIIRQGEFVNNTFTDLYIFSMLKDEWKG